MVFHNFIMNVDYIQNNLQMECGRVYFFPGPHHVVSSLAGLLRGFDLLDTVTLTFDIETRLKTLPIYVL